MTAQSGAPAFPWDAVMHAGLGLLRLDPSIFWRLTPREFAAACGALASPSPAFGRRDLETLMQFYPDGSDIWPKTAT